MGGEALINNFGSFSKYKWIICIIFLFLLVGSVDAAIYTSQYPLYQNTTDVKSTSVNLLAAYYPYYATDPTKSVTGTWANNNWLGCETITTNQRFHIDLGSSKIIKRVYYENSHAGDGTSENTGVKNYTLWGSNTAGSFANLTYANDTGWTQLPTSTLSFNQHVAANVADPQYITVVNTGAYRYYAFKFANNYGNVYNIGLRRVELQTEDIIDFSSNTTSGIAPFSVLFNVTSSGNQTGWTWLFGDENWSNISWVVKNSSSGWVTRYGHATVVLTDGSIVLTGGFDTSVLYNDTWRSTDNGSTWTRLNVSSGWAARNGHAMVALSDGSIVLFGGGGGSVLNDTWRSTDKGITWTRMNASSGWAARQWFSGTTMMDDSIVLAGGYTGIFLNDVWRSTDYGATWTRMNASAGWSPRYTMSIQTLKDNSILIMGGSNATASVSYNDTWRSINNGATWTQVNASGGWMGGHVLSTGVMSDGSIIITGGYNYALALGYNQTWRSTNNGATWALINSNPGWQSRWHLTSVVIPNGSMVMTGGAGAGGIYNDTWIFTPVSSILENTSHVYTLVGTYNVSLQTYNVGGFNSTQKSAYIKSSIPSYTSINGIYTVVKFNNTGSTQWTAPVGINKVDYLVVAGGGAGGDVMGGGGGAGGFLDGFNYSVTSLTNYTIVIGDGGKALDTSDPAYHGVKGGNSTFDAIISFGGGGGGSHAYGNATSGGSGGGGGSNNQAGSASGGSNVSGQGWAGGNSAGFWYYGGAGGGGAGQAGSDSVGGIGSNYGGNGGNGKNSSITGVNVTYAGGGGGGGSKYGNNVNGTGGTGGGGNGGGGPGQSTNATDELGGGGGGVYHDIDYPGNSTIDGTFGRGGSGIVILRYLTPIAPVANFTSNVTISSAPVAVQFNDTSVNLPTGWAWFFGEETYNQSWTQQNASAGWTGRSKATSVALPDGSIVIMSGYNSAGSVVYNDTWRSINEGVTWTQQNVSSGWAARQFATSVVLSDGSIVIMGGTNGIVLYNDTWRSINNGLTWTQMNASSGWSARYGPSAVSLPDGSIVITGGVTSTTYTNDTWRSTDNGATWTRLNTSSGWAGRYQHHAVTMTDGSIILTSGVGPVGGFSDVWRSNDNGITWTQMNASAPFGIRYAFALNAMPDNSVILMGGQSGGAKNDVWRSVDNGVLWTQVNASAGWGARWELSSSVLVNGSVIVLSGYDGNYKNDVWKFQPVGSSVQNATYIYTHNGQYNVSMQSYNSAGYNLTRKNNYIDLGLSPVSYFYATEPSGINGYVTFTVSVTNASSNSPTSWNWSFGDGSYSNLQDAIHSYTVAGNYSITLNTSNIYGYNISAGYYWINVSNPVMPPTSDFTGTPVTGLSPLPVTFTDTSLYATGWGWFFHDETYNQSWTQINASSSWVGRFQHSVVALHDGEILLMGGTNGTRMNGTWRSIDYGLTWTQINASSGWTARQDQLAVLMQDGSIVLMGGIDSSGNSKNDTWRSTDEGFTWTLMNASSGWLPRFGLSGIAVQDSSNSIVIMGGSNGTRMNDVWQSTNYGSTWSLMNSSPGWAARYDAGSVVMQDGSIVLMGGASGSFYNDVWRSTDKGATWVQQTPSASWGARYRFTTVRMPDNSIVLMGGSPVGGNDVWRSTNYGVTWTQVNSSAGWSQRSGHASVVMPNSSILVMGGNDGFYVSDVWNFQPVGSAVQNPSHTFYDSGFVDISLRTYNMNGYNTTVKSSYISVIGPSSAFNATPNPVQLGGTVSFVDMSTNSVTAWNWSFGDGNYSTAQNVTHIFPTIGVFNVTLNASNIYGFSNSTVDVTVYPSTPVANFTVDYNIGSAPLTVQFTDTTTGSGLTNWYWVFGDGNTDTTQNPSHQYASIGTYYAQLTATSSSGSNTSQPVTIYVVSSAVPIVDFSGAPTSGSAPMSVQFTDLSAALGGVNAWNWSFGDGNYSNSQNPVHIYSSGGQYSVTLVATSGAFSNVTSKTGYISVGVLSNSVSADYITNTTYSITYPVAIQFNDLSVCSPVCTNWVWDFNGDGSIDSLEQNPAYVYTYPGNYSPKLIVSNGINTGTKIRINYISIGPAFVAPTIPQPTSAWKPGYQYNGTLTTFKGNANIDLPNSTYLKYWLQNFSTTKNFSVYGFATGLMAPIMHVFGFWIFLIIWGLYLFAVWIRSQDVTMPLIIGILTMGTFGLLFPKESLPVIIIMFVICGAIIITKLMKDSI
jgi:PKD repeat protein